MYRLVIFFTCIVFSSHIFAQKKVKITDLQSDILKESAKYNTYKNLKKSRHFFAKNEWDSTLVYTAKALSLDTKNTELINYCYLMRGFSFISKSLFKET